MKKITKKMVSLLTALLVALTLVFTAVPNVEAAAINGNSGIVVIVPGIEDEDPEIAEGETEEGEPEVMPLGDDDWEPEYLG